LEGARFSSLLAFKRQGQLLYSRGNTKRETFFIFIFRKTLASAETQQKQTTGIDNTAK